MDLVRSQVGPTIDNAMGVDCRGLKDPMVI